MADFGKVMENLKKRGYAVHEFTTAKEAAECLNDVIDGVSVGFGGSATLDVMGLYDMLCAHNTVYWHWKQEKDQARKAAMQTDVYLTSANALAESGEIINIDGIGNRVASTLFGHQKVYYVIGENKLEPDFEKAVARARNIAAPQRAAQFGKKTPCVVSGQGCQDCRSPERVCRAMVVLWEPMMGMDAEVILIHEQLGL